MLWVTSADSSITAGRDCQWCHLENTFLDVSVKVFPDRIEG